MFPNERRMNCDLDILLVGSWNTASMLSEVIMLAMELG